jgi:predicted SAM-dependent methyltransferase
MPMLNFKKLFFYRQHPDTAIRYYPIIQILKSENLLDGSVLEIGSGSYGIAPYLKRQITGVDVEFHEPEFELLQQVKGSATHLPFDDKSFDVVILSDVLEHLPKEIREKSINEAIRVAKKIVFISGPCGEKSFAQDKKLADYSMKKLGKMHPFFIDHLKLGLPDVSEIVKICQKNKQTKNVKVVGEFFNLSAREWLMKWFITNNKLQFYFYLKGLMFLVPIFVRLNKRPGYRSLIQINIQK